MRISLFEGGYTNLISNDTLEDWNELVDVLVDVKPGVKNGPYITRGYCDGPRADTNMKSIDLIVIDGDSLTNKPGTCCPPDGVHELFKQKNITHCIHSSYSQNLVNSIFKWRMVIPCKDLVDAGSLSQGVSEVISLLHENQFMVKNVREHTAISQCWFLPRCPEGLEDDFYSAYHDGEPWKLGSVPVVPTAKVTFIDSNTGNGNGNGNGAFSWDWAISQLKSGTIHQAAKSICGWLISTTDWAPSQIKTYLTTLISALCPDPVKVKRAIETKEIDNLIQYCREHHGVIENVANWKTNFIMIDKLRDKVFPPVKWAVDGIIPEGLTILAGDAKAGKSLMAVDICSAIASGIEAFGNRKCVQGQCVYFSLEDPERRVQERIRRQSDIWPVGAFGLATNIGSQLGPAFYDMLEENLIMLPDLRCIVFDTMQYIIPGKPPGVTDYEHYYKHLDPLHRWANLNHIAVVLITHLTKSRLQDGDNPFSSIIGSVAIQGVADAMILLRKNHIKGDTIDPDLPDGFMTIQGREMGSDKFAMELDTEALRWCIIREADIKDETDNPSWLLIADELKKKPMGSPELSSKLKMNKSTIKTCLKRMFDKKLIIKLERGVYGIVGIDYDNINPW